MSSERKSEQQQLMDEIAKISVNKDFLAKCQNTIRKVFSSFIDGQSTELR